MRRGEALTKNSPHALRRGWPSGSLRQSGVLVVWQFVHTVGDASPSSFFEDWPEVPIWSSGVLLRQT